MTLFWRTKKNYRIFITGTSNCNALTTSILKLSYVKDNPKIKLYRDHQNFDNDLFKVNLENGLRNLTDSTYTKFLETLDYHAPIKKKNLWANENSFMNKPLRKALMLRSRESTIDLNRSNYKKQRNFCTYLFCKTKKEYFSQIWSQKSKTPKNP